MPKVGIQWNLSKADTIGTNKNRPLWRGCPLVRGLLYIMWAIFSWDPVTVHYRGMRVSSKRGSTDGCEQNEFHRILEF